MTTTPKNVVLYHKNCTDGFASAWTAHRYFNEEAFYVAVSDRENTPEEVDTYNQKKEVTLYILDFCYPANVIEVLKKDFKKVIILDHHITSKNDITHASDYVYGTTKSGAYLAWEYFFPGTEVPKMISYISDNDVWAHTLPYHTEVSAYVANRIFDFEVFDVLCAHFESNFEEILAMGSELLVAHKRKIAIAEKSAGLVEFEGHTVYAVNATGDIRNDIGHTLATKTDSFSLVYYYDQDVFKCSLRSVVDFDVSKIAEKYGGGGHKNAAAFVVRSGFPIPFIKSALGKQ